MSPHEIIDRAKERFGVFSFPSRAEQAREIESLNRTVESLRKELAICANRNAEAAQEGYKQGYKDGLEYYRP